MNENYLFIVMGFCILFLIVYSYILGMKEKEMTRLQRLYKLKRYFLHNLVEDSMDGSEFDCAVLDAFEFLEERFKDE